MSPTPSYIAPNLIIVSRVAMAFVAVALLSAAAPEVAVWGVVLTVVVLALDGLDGIVARRQGVTSDLGGVLDITADRVVEHIFWIYFAVAHQVGVWAPFVIMTRSFVVDTARSLALVHGRGAFGEATMARSPLTRFLTSSRFMRTAYGSAKVAAFVLLGAMVTLDAASTAGTQPLSPGALHVLELAASVSVISTVALCVVRGIPVVWDSRAYLTPPSIPAGAGPGA